MNKSVIRIASPVQLWLKISLIEPFCLLLRRTYTTKMSYRNKKNLLLNVLIDFGSVEEKRHTDHKNTRHKILLHELLL